MEEMQVRSREDIKKIQAINLKLDRMASHNKAVKHQKSGD